MGRPTFEVVVERLCQKYHKLPSEVLEEDLEWIEILIAITNKDAEMTEVERNRAKFREEAIKHGYG